MAPIFVGTDPNRIRRHFVSMDALNDAFTFLDSIKGATAQPRTRCPTCRPVQCNVGRTHVDAKPDGYAG